MMLMFINSLSGPEIAIQLGSRLTGAGPGVGGIVSLVPQLKNLDILGVVAGEQLSPSLLLDVSCGCSVSVWQVFLSPFLAFVLFLQSINTSEGHLRYLSKQKQASTSHRKANPCARADGQWCNRK